MRESATLEPPVEVAETPQATRAYELGSIVLVHILGEWQRRIIIENEHRRPTTGNILLERHGPDDIVSYIGGQFNACNSWEPDAIRPLNDDEPPFAEGEVLRIVDEPEGEERWPYYVRRCYQEDGAWYIEFHSPNEVGDADEGTYIEWMVCGDIRHWLPSDGDPGITASPPTPQPATESTPQQMITNTHHVNRDIRGLMQNAPASRLTAEHADFDAWRTSRVRVPNPPPTTVEGWADLIKAWDGEVAERRGSTPEPAPARAEVRRVATPAATSRDNDIAFTVDGSGIEDGQVTRYATRRVSFSVPIPRRIALQGENAIRDYYDAHKWDDADVDDWDEGDVRDTDFNGMDDEDIDTDIEDELNDWRDAEGLNDEDEDEEE